MSADLEKRLHELAEQGAAAGKPSASYIALVNWFKEFVREAAAIGAEWMRERAATAALDRGCEGEWDSGIDCNDLLLEDSECCTPCLLHRTIRALPLEEP